jgi:pimeloyl-ACP methyl ester carboxylesterase
MICWIRRVIYAALAVAVTAGTTGMSVASDYDPAPHAEVDGLEARFVDVGGQRTRYYDYGEGEPLVLVHGGGRGTTSSANNFSPVIPLLARHFRVLAIDKSAAGMTDNPLDDNDLSYEGEAKHARRFIETLGLGPVHLVGHSSGGAMAFYLAVTDPQVVKTLTVVSSGPGMPPAGDGPSRHDERQNSECEHPQTTYEGRKCRLELLAHRSDTFTDEFLRADMWMADQPKSVEARRKYAAARSGALPSGEITTAYRDRMWERARTEGMDMPVLILTGKQDTLSWDAADRHAMLRRELGFFDIVGTRNPRVKMVVINETGHFPYREHPELFTAELVSFIEFWKVHTELSRR